MYYGKQLREIANALRQLLGLHQHLSAINESIEKHTEALGAAQEGQKQRAKVKQEWLEEIFTEYKKSERNKAEIDDRQYHLQNSLRWATWLAFGAAALYAGIAAFQYGQMKSATQATRDAADAAKKAADVADSSFRLSKRHMEDTDEAVVSVRGEAIEDGSNVYRVTMVNNGKVSAHSIAVHIEISQHVLPSDIRQRTFAAFDISQDELRNDVPVLKEVVLNDFGPSDWDRIHALRESITIEGRLSYENGFDDRRNPAFCQELLTQPNPPGNTPASMNVLVDCDRLPSFLPPLYKRLREMKGH